MLSTNTSLSPAIPENRCKRHLTPIAQKIERLHTLSGLTAFERDFIAQLRSQPVVFADQLPVLIELWQRHGNHEQPKPATDAEGVAEMTTPTGGIR